MSDKISYAHVSDPGGQRFIQYAKDPIPSWAVDVKSYVEEEKESVQIIVTSCNECPYCKNHYSPNLHIYEGTTCSHKDNKSPIKVFLGIKSSRMRNLMK